jgi:transcriptional regulator with XRE-family HTH domain
MKEYELTLTIKNAVLLNLMRSKGISTAAQLSRDSGVNQQTLSKFLNLSISPFTKQGDLRKDAEVLVSFFGLPIEFLFPNDELYLSMDKNKFTAQVSKDEMVRLSGSCPSLLLEEAENESSEPFNGMLENTKLSNRQRLALKLRYKDDLTLKDIGKELGGVTSTRAIDIIHKAERILRTASSHGHDLAGIAGKYNSTHLDLIKDS